MGRLAFEGFTVICPEGWLATLDESTYSDPSGAAPVRLLPAHGFGELLVSRPALHPDEQPGADAVELESLAREWGLRRGIDEPLSVSTEVREGSAGASASYRLGDEFIQLWFVSNGSSMLKVSYVCPWSERDRDRAAREALVGSLRFA
jgi:hypothetical protein